MAAIRVKPLGALAIIYPLLHQKLQLAHIIDEIIPPSNGNLVTNGRACPARAAEIMVANICIARQPLYRMQNWVNDHNIGPLYKVRPEYLNDDRLGRLLEVIYEHEEQLKSALMLQLCRQFKVTPQQFHYDITQYFLVGEFKDQQEEAVQITYGNRQITPYRKEVKLSLSVSNKEGIPFYYQSLNGNADGKRALRANLEACLELMEKFCPPGEILMVSDSGNYSLENAAFMMNRNIGFIAAQTITSTYEKLFFEATATKNFEPIEYVPLRDVNKPEEQQDKYWGLETSHTFTHKGKVHSLRVLFFKSERLQQQRVKQRKKHVTKIVDRLRQISRSIEKGASYYQDRQRVQQQVDKLLSKNPARKFFDISVIEKSTDNGKTRPLVQWRIKKEVVKRTKKLEGVFMRHTNLDADKYHLSRILNYYKGQDRVEKCHATIKNPLHITPMFLHKNTRIQGMHFLVFVALVTYAVIEMYYKKALREGLVDELEAKISKNKPKKSGEKTSRLIGKRAQNIFQMFGLLHLIYKKDDQGRYCIEIEDYTTIQLRILSWMNIDRPRLSWFSPNNEYLEPYFAPG